MLADRDRRHDEEKGHRENRMATYDLYFQELFTRLRVPMPPMQAQPNNSGTEQVVAGQLSGFQGLHFPMQPPHEGSFQALLSHAPLRNNEITGGVMNGGAIYLQIEPDLLSKSSYFCEFTTCSISAS